MNKYTKEESLKHIQEILRRVRSGEERTYSIDEVEIMLGLQESSMDTAIEQQMVDRAARIKVLEELIAEEQRLNLANDNDDNNDGQYCSI